MGVVRICARFVRPWTETEEGITAPQEAPEEEKPMRFPYLVLLSLFTCLAPADHCPGQAPPSGLVTAHADPVVVDQTRVCAMPKGTSRLHCVLILDTNATELAQYLVSDYAWLHRYLLTPVAEHGQLGTCRVLSGPTATPAQAIAEVRSLSLSPADPLLVYYAGHGGIKRQDGKHYLGMKQGELSRSQLIDAMTAQNPRLAVLLTDCCSNYYSAAPSRQAISVRDFATNWDTIQRLFFDLEGRVSVTAAKPGQLAYVGVFTSAFCSALTASPSSLGMDGRRNWTPFLQQVTARTKDYYPAGQPCHPFYLGPWPKR
jgi:hypothetical protein